MPFAWTVSQLSESVTMSENFNDTEKPQDDTKENADSVNSAGDGINLPVSIDSGIEEAKHPLEHTWTLWYFENDRTRTWEENQREITTFATVEDFWSIYMHIRPAGELKQGCDYSLFKKGIRPMWEDKHNKRGGRWLLPLDKKQRQNDLDKYWLEISLCLIGEAFADPEEICGAVVNVRGKGDKIALWTADANNQKAAIDIGLTLKERLRIPPKVQLGYQIHKDTMAKSGSVTRNTYTV